MVQPERSTSIREEASSSSNQLLSPSSLQLTASPSPSIPVYYSSPKLLYHTVMASSSSNAAPRPILKSSSRKSSTCSTPSTDSSPPPSPSSSKPSCVQFSQCLSTTFYTHGACDYNRSPITVTPNSCALPSRRSRAHDEEGAALRQFRLEAEGRPVPALIHDDGDSSSEESDVSIPSPTYNIPTSLLKSRRNSNSRQSTPKRSPYSSYAPAYSIPEPTSNAYMVADRDDIFGGF